MKVRMLTTAASPEGVWAAGQVVDLPEKMAKQLMAGGFAVAVAAEEKQKQAVETAALEQPEKAVKPKPGKKKVK